MRLKPMEKTMGIITGPVTVEVEVEAEGFDVGVLSGTVADSSAPVVPLASEASEDSVFRVFTLLFPSLRPLKFLSAVPSVSSVFSLSRCRFIKRALRRGGWEAESQTPASSVISAAVDVSFPVGSLAFSLVLFGLGIESSRVVSCGVRTLLL